MDPYISGTQFGSITVERKIYDHDIVINLKGEVIKRKKKLSKKVYGTSHTVSLEEAKFILQENAEIVIIGNGQHGVLRLSDEAKEYFRKKHCKVQVLPTPEAVEAWNNEEGNAVGMFHITC